MRALLKIAIGVIAVLSIVLIIGSLQNLSDFQQEKDASPSTTVKPPSVPDASQGPNLAISYSIESVNSIPSHYDYFATPDSGNVFLKATVTIKNNGYDDPFSTNQLYFHVIADDDIKYNVDLMGDSALDEWQIVDVMDGGTYKGTMVFQVPATTTSVTMSYEPISLTDYNIIWSEV